MGEKESWRRFLKLCLELKTVKEWERFLELFLTIEEKHLLASRCQIVKALLEGKLSQREIAKQHGVSIAQITRGSNALKRIDPQMEKFLRENL